VQPSLAARAHEEIDRIRVALRSKCRWSFRSSKATSRRPTACLNEVGLSSLVQQQATRVFHLAAVYDLAVPQDLLCASTLVARGNVVELARSLPHLKQFHHVSTCYVAGKREGVILETELRHEAGYRNYYEESKYLSELEVDSSKPICPHDLPAFGGLW
jgi:nucleoside-diphosphate-sugar epimerase